MSRLYRRYIDTFPVRCIRRMCDFVDERPVLLCVFFAATSVLLLGTGVDNKGPWGTISAILFVPSIILFVISLSLVAEDISHRKRDKRARL